MRACVCACVCMFRVCGCECVCACVCFVCVIMYVYVCLTIASSLLHSLRHLPLILIDFTSSCLTSSTSSVIRFPF